jgi:hypothetical protein
MERGGHARARGCDAKAHLLGQQRGKPAENVLLEVRGRRVAQDRAPMQSRAILLQTAHPTLRGAAAVTAGTPAQETPGGGACRESCDIPRVVVRRRLERVQALQHRPQLAAAPRAPGAHLAPRTGLALCALLLRRCARHASPGRCGALQAGQNDLLGQQPDARAYSCHRGGGEEQPAPRARGPRRRRRRLGRRGRVLPRRYMPLRRSGRLWVVRLDGLAAGVSLEARVALAQRWRRRRTVVRSGNADAEGRLECCEGPVQRLSARGPVSRCE